MMVSRNIQFRSILGSKLYTNDTKSYSTWTIQIPIYVPEAGPPKSPNACRTRSYPGHPDDNVEAAQSQQVSQFTIPGQGRGKPVMLPLYRLCKGKEIAKMPPPPLVLYTAHINNDFPRSSHTVLPPQSGIFTPSFRFRLTSIRPQWSSQFWLAVLN